MIEGLPTVIRAASGSYIASVLQGAYHPILVYDAKGRLTGTIGGRGRGPGEFTYASAIAPLADGGIVVAHDHDRLSFFDSAGRYTGGLTSHLPRVSRILELPDGRLALVAAATRSPDWVGDAVHLMDRSGNRIRGLGSENFFPVGATYAERVLAAGRNGSVWISEIRNYRVELVDTLNRSDRILAIHVPGEHVATVPALPARPAAAARAQPSEARPTRLKYRPMMEVTGIYADSGGILWSAVRVAVPQWKSLELAYDMRLPEEIRTTDETKIRSYRTLIDAVEVSTGRLLARHTLDGYAALMNDGRLVRSSFTATGELAVSMNTLTLLR